MVREKGCAISVKGGKWEENSFGVLRLPTARALDAFADHPVTVFSVVDPLHALKLKLNARVRLDEVCKRVERQV